MNSEEIIRKGRKLEVSSVCAVIVQMVGTVDLDVLDEMIAEESKYQTIEPIMDPTRWMRDHKGLEATWAVLRAVRNLRSVVDANKGPGRNDDLSPGGYSRRIVPEEEDNAQV